MVGNLEIIAEIREKGVQIGEPVTISKGSEN